MSAVSEELNEKLSQKRWMGSFYW